MVHSSHTGAEASKLWDPAEWGQGMRDHKSSHIWTIYLASAAVRTWIISVHSLIVLSSCPHTSVFLGHFHPRYVQMSQKHCCCHLTSQCAAPGAPEKPGGQMFHLYLSASSLSLMRSVTEVPSTSFCTWAEGSPAVVGLERTRAGGRGHNPGVHPC